MGSFLSFIGLDMLCRQLYHLLDRKNFVRSLNEKAFVNYVSRLVSNVHAVVATVLGFYCIYHTPLTSANLVYSSMHMHMVALFITAGYLCYDLLNMLRNWDALMDNTMVVHHLVCLTSFIVGVVYGRGNLIQVAFLVNEASTPFLNQRWFLLEAGKKNTAFYKVNLGLFALTFVAFRVVWNTALLGAVVWCWHENLWQAVVGVEFAVCLLLTLLCGVHCCINYRWGYMIVGKFVQAVTGRCSSAAGPKFVAFASAAAARPVEKEE